MYVFIPKYGKNMGKNMGQNSLNMPFKFLILLSIFHMNF